MQQSLPFIAFFVSGASSLIFQTLWTRLLHHVFGATSVAISSVLTVFMAGLGLGAYLFGRWGDNWRRPLVIYAIAELGVGLWALAIPWWVGSDGWLSGVNAWLREALGAGSFTFMLARFACVVPILLVPTTLMGATLPLLARHFVQFTTSPARVGSRVGALYAINTLGAVAGTGLGAFVLMPAVGVWRTNTVAACMNLCLAGVIWLMRDRLSAPAADEKVAVPIAQPAKPATPSPGWLPRLAVVAFGVSGACALGYEVVWSRALSMAIGSSVQAFALILETFLVGIALGSAAMAPLLAAPHAPRAATLRAALRASPTVYISAALALGLTPIAHAQLAMQSGLPAFLVAVTLGWLAVGLVSLVSLKRTRDATRLAVDHGIEPSLGAALSILALPCAGAAWHAIGAVTKKSRLAPTALHGYLPYISVCVVLLVSLFGALLIVLRRRQILAAAGLQLYIGLATFGSYLFQDEVPYTFARLVSGLNDLPDHVGTVRFFMFFTAALCTLPATLGMGAMFPLTLRIWSSGGERVADDVGTVYTANTLGSIAGAWLPGFVLMPWLGMESTLLFGILVNLALALILAVAEDLPLGERARWPTYVLACAIAPLGAAMYLAVFSANSPLRWDLSRMTLGTFRVSLADDVLDPQSWGEPELLYYRDGLSTTVSVEKWGAHLSLKNNGKVDASNGDDMPTQVMVAAYPLLLHPRGPAGLDVALIGFGSGVTVGAALQFPIAHLDVVELEARVVEAAIEYFEDVNHLKRTLDEFPYVTAPRLRIHTDDGRNFLAAAKKRYDVIISEPSNPWITGVSDLFTVEHFTTTKRKLKPGGIYCQWVQLYELSPTNIKTIYRTFASQFRHVAVFASEDLSSDTILLGSDRPLTFSLPKLAHHMATPRVSTELLRAHVQSPQDLLSRILFRSRREVMQYARDELRLHSGRWQPKPRSTGKGPCPRESCRRLPVPLNTDDNMRIELAAPRDLIGFAAYKGYLQTFYGPAWPYGELSGRVHYTPGAEARERAQIALSLAAHGRVQRAKGFAEQASRLSSAADVQLAARVLQQLTIEDGFPPLHLEPPDPGPQMSPQTKAELKKAYARVVKYVRSQRFDDALRLLEEIPGPLRLHSGPALRMLYGYLLWRTGDGDGVLLRSAVFHLEELVRERPDFVRDYPQLLFYLARARQAVGSYEAAVHTMRAYLQARKPLPPDPPPPIVGPKSTVDPESSDPARRGA